LDLVEGSVSRKLSKHGREQLLARWRGEEAEYLLEEKGVL
jgi:hypothetical protein